MNSTRESFLRKAAAAAASGGHIFPQYAACEAALESGWGLSRLAVEANNLFGQKQSHPEFENTETLTLPTREFLCGAWVTVQANWVRFGDWQTCFSARMSLLLRLSRDYPNYAGSLSAKSGEQFITEVSKTWSTDPDRAGKVLEVFDAHRTSFI